MLNYELLFLIFDYINNRNICEEKTSLISIFYLNKIYTKNKYINTFINNKNLINLSFTNKLCYSIYDTVIIKCDFCKRPLITNKEILNKSCQNNICKLKNEFKRDLKNLLY
jgi:hypothetical protein